MVVNMYFMHKKPQRDTGRSLSKSTIRAQKLVRSLIKKAKSDRDALIKRVMHEIAISEED